MQNISPMVDSSGVRYNIPDDQKEQFASEFGDQAQPLRRYRTGDGQTYSIPHGQAEDFMKDFPDATPLRSISFAGGETREFSPEELQSFFSDNGEYATSEKYKADRDEEIAKQKRRSEEESKATMDAYYKGRGEELKTQRDKEAAARGARNFELDQQAAEGGSFFENLGKELFTAVDRAGHSAMSYATEKAVAPWTGMVSGALKAVGTMLHGHGKDEQGNNRGTAMGDWFVDAGKGIDNLVEMLTADKADQDQNAFTETVGKYNELGSTISAFYMMNKALGPAGPLAMGLTAQGNTYVALYDEAINSGKSPQEADRIATTGGTVSLAGTALIGYSPVGRMLGKHIGIPTVASTTAMNGFRDLVNRINIGYLKSYLLTTIGSSGEAALEMALQSYGETIVHKSAQGKDWGWDDPEALWAAANAGGEGLALGAILGVAHYPAFRASMRQPIETSIKNMARTPQGRATMGTMFPDATRALVEKSQRGEDISRSDITKAGYPEMTQVERNFLARQLLKDKVQAEAWAREQAKKPAAEPEAAKPAGLIGDGNASTETPAAPAPKGPTPPPAPAPAEAAPKVPPKVVAKTAPAETPKNAPVSAPQETAATEEAKSAEAPTPSISPKIDEFTNVSDGKGGKMAPSVAASEGGADAVHSLAKSIRSTWGSEKGAYNEEVKSLVDTVIARKDPELTKMLGDIPERIERGATSLRESWSYNPPIDPQIARSMDPDARYRVEHDIWSRNRDIAKKFGVEFTQKEPQPPAESVDTHMQSLSSAVEAMINGEDKSIPQFDTAVERASKFIKGLDDQGLVDAFKKLNPLDKHISSDPAHILIGDVYEEAGKRGIDLLAPKEKPAAKPSGDLKKDLAGLSDDDLDALINSAVAKKEAADAEAAPKVNKGKGPVPATAAKPAAKTVNKGKGPVPAKAARPVNKGKGKAAARADRERAAVTQGYTGKAAQALSDLYDIFGASDSVKGGIEGMAARPLDNFDENLYNTRVRGGFDAILAETQANGGGTADFVETIVNRFGASVAPYIKRFVSDLKRGAANGQQSAEGNRDGLGGGADENAGRGASSSGADAQDGEANDGGVRAGDSGTDRDLPAGAEDGGRGGQGDGVSAGDRQMAGDGPDRRRGGAASRDNGKHVASEDADAGGDAGGPHLVHAANGNIDTRACAPVRLTPGQRAKVNAQAIELAKKPVGTLTDAELDILRQYTGEGGLGYKDKSIEKKIAALNQHFSDYPVIDGIWDALERAKVPMKTALEPSAGVGNFATRRPDIDWTCVELEKDTASVLRHLLPAAKVMQGTFEDVQLKDKVDLAISNVPFLETRAHPNRPDIKALHDFFFVHGLDQIKDNGVQAFITSEGTAKKLDGTVRREIVSKADVIGMFKLPADMFKANADTSVTTDIIFLQKRPEGVEPRPENKAVNDLFVETVSSEGENGDRLTLNKYFSEHPECMLGDLSIGKDTLHGGRMVYVLSRSDATDLSQISVDYRPYPVRSEMAATANTGKGAGASSYPHDVDGLEKSGVHFVLSDGGDGSFGQNIRVVDGVPMAVAEEFTLDGYAEGTNHRAKVFEPIGGEAGKKIAKLAAIMADANAYQGGDEAAGLRGTEEIAAYREKFGTHPLKDRALRSLFKKHGDTGFLEQLGSFFAEDFTPSEAFTSKLRHEDSGYKAVKMSDPLDRRAFASEDNSCEIHMDGKHCMIEEGEVSTLCDQGYSISTVDAKGRPVLQNDVLFASGNIYRKIDAQRALKEAHPELAAQIDRQIAKLEAAKPVPRTFDQIRFTGTEGFVPAAEAGKHGTCGWSAKAMEMVGVNVVDYVDDNGITRFSVNSTDLDLLGPQDAELLSRYLSGQKLVKKEKNQSDDAHMREIQQAESNLADIYARIRSAINANEEARDIIERGANEANNAYVSPDYSRLERLVAPTFEKFKRNTDGKVTLRINQTRWATKAFVEGRGLNAHDVGGGKTYAALALSDMMLEHGSAKRIAISVPKQTLMKWAADAQRVMPDRKIMVAGNLDKSSRASMLGKIANSDVQIVFFTHDGFENLDLPVDAEAEGLETYIGEVMGNASSREDAVKLIRARAYIDQQKARERDTRFTLDKLGFDAIICDEAHNFKNVGCNSSIPDKVGLALSFEGGKRNEATGKTSPVKISSARSMDFRLKCDYISGRNNGRNVFLLTATPSPNKPMEVYTMLRHMGRGILEDYGIFDDAGFARTFFRIGSRSVISADGDPKVKPTLTKILKVYELRDMLSRFMDRIPMSQFAKDYGIKVPEANERHAFVKMSEGARAVAEDLKNRMRHLPKGWKKRQGEDTVIAIYTDGLRAAASELGYEGPHAGITVDMRSFDTTDDKIEWTADYATQAVREADKAGSTPHNVVVFCDTLAQKRADRGGMTIHQELKQALVGRGFKPEEVIVATGQTMTDPKTGKEVKGTDDLKFEIAQAFSPEAKEIARPTARVIIATRVFAEGINLQRFGGSLIHMDQPITNGMIQQRNGRVIRFGNEHENVNIIHLFKTGSFDQLAHSLATGKKGWNEAIWDKAAAAELDVSEEFSGGSIPDGKAIEIEMIEDPIEKLRRKAEYQLEATRDRINGQIAEVSAAKEAVTSNEMDERRTLSEADNAAMAARESDRKSKEIEEDKIPNLRRLADTAKGELVAGAKDLGVKGVDDICGEIESLIGKRETVRATQVDQQKASAAYYAQHEGRTVEEAERLHGELVNAEEALKNARLDYNDTGKRITQLVNALPESLRPFARVYRENVEGICQAQSEMVNLRFSANAARKRQENKMARVPSIVAGRPALEERVRIEEGTLADLQKQYADYGNEWYTDFGGPAQEFNLEHATMMADIEAGNRKEDEFTKWKGTRQTLDMMPAPASTGSRALPGSAPGSRGRLPSADTPIEARGTTRAKNPTSKSQIIQAAKRLFPELSFRSKGTYPMRGVLGHFEVENRIIRSKDPNAIQVVAHELGHAIFRMGESELHTVMPNAARADFIALGKDLYGDRPPAGGFTGEGFAEFVRGFICDYDLAKDFPEATRWFFEDFGGNNPEFVGRLFQLKERVLDYTGMEADQAVRAMWDHRTPWTERMLRFALKHFDGGKFRKNWVDSNDPILSAMKKIGVDYEFHDRTKTPEERSELVKSNPYMLATLFQGSAVRFAEQDVLCGSVNLLGQPTGASLAEILYPICKRGKDTVASFKDFAVAMRGAHYHKLGLEFGASRNEVAAAIRKNRSPEFRRVLDDITEWSNRQLHLLVDAGALTPKEYQDIVDSRAVYIPIHRILEEGAINERRMKHGRKALFHLKGGSGDIEDIVVALTENAIRVRQAAQQAKIVQSIVDMYDRANRAGTKGLSQVMVEMPNQIKVERIWAEKIKKQLGDIAKARFGASDADIEAGLKQTWTDELFVYSTKAYTGKEKIISIRDKTGKLRTFEVRDQGLLDVLAGYTRPPKESVGMLERTGQILANGIRMGATVLKGSFSLVANPIRDTATAFHMQEYGNFIPLVSSVDGVINSVLNTDLKKAYFRLGGDMGSFYNGGSRVAAKHIAAQAQTVNGAMRMLKKGLFTMIGDLMSHPEIGPRLVTMRNAMNWAQGEGLDREASEMLGALCARDVTVDFSRAGEKARKWNRWILFMNAGIRELDQLARNHGLADPLPWQNPGDAAPDPSISDSAERMKQFAKDARSSIRERTLGRGMALMAMALLGYATNWLDDEDGDSKEKLRRFEELKPSYKWNNVCMGNVRLPVPFIDGLIYQALPVALIESARTGKADPVNEVATEIIRQLPITMGTSIHQWARNFSPLSPETDIMSNRTWDEREIVPSRIRKLDSREWKTESTSKFAVMFGNAVQDMLPPGDLRDSFAPIYIDYLMDQHTGGLLTGLVRDFESATARRGAIGVNGDYTRLPVIGRVFLSPFSSSRVPGDFYQEMSQLEGKYAAAANGKMAVEELGKLRCMGNVYEKHLSEVNAARRAVLSREDLSAEEQKRLGDKLSKTVIDTIRAFRDAGDGSYRRIGVQSVAGSLSNPGTPESVVQQNLAIMSASGVTSAELRGALDVYGRMHGWSKETLKRRREAMARRMVNP